MTGTLGSSCPTGGGPPRPGVGAAGAARCRPGRGRGGGQGGDEGAGDADRDPGPGGTDGASVVGGPHPATVGRPPSGGKAHAGSTVLRPRWRDACVSAGSRPRSTTPSATSTAGPASSTPWSSSRRTVRRPPGTSTSHVAPVSREPAQKLVAIAAAQAPVPHDRVSPTPRSCTRIATCPGPIGRTSSTFVPCTGSGRTTGGLERSTSSRSTCSGSATTVWGLPRSTLSAENGSPPSRWTRASKPSRAAVAASARRHGPRPTANPSPSTRTCLTPARVAIANSSEVSSPSRRRNAANTRVPLPHISDRLPSALR